MAQTKANILVVDDDAGVRNGLQRILGGVGYATTGAETAEDALERLVGDAFDLVLTDLQMPGMDGLALLEEIKQISPDIPVVMITAYGSMDVVIRALRSGVSDFVTKPFKPEDLLGIVEREVARYQRAASQSSAPAVLGLQLSAQQIDEIDHLLAEIRAEVAARCILLIEGTGHLIDAKGSIEDINISALASLVAGDFAATSGIASLIGEEDAFRLNYHEGDRYSVYSAQVAPDVFLLIVFGQEIKLGSVLYYARQIIPRLQKIVGSAAVVPRPPAPPTPPPAATVTVVTEESAPEWTAPSGPAEVFSFEEALNSGLLGDNVLDAFDAQFASLWGPGEDTG
ncbi:MAG: sigma-54-dependent Fis family transcriptional regulator [Anaerolineae bacterium]|nr:sigma-54-dependent Fis family transcriptional regulator [Anaerolineae bacterium]